MSTDTPSIQGFNVPLALRQLGNNLKLYTKLLDQFQKTYDSAANEAAENIASGDFETAERAAHTIKGLAGSLGATALQEISASLEKLCRDQAAGSDLDATVALFGKEIDAAVSAIRTYLAASAQPAPQAAAPQVNTAMLASQLAGLAAHIDDSDARALMLFDEMRPQIAAYDSQAAARMASAFELFDFAAAAEVVAALRARLG